LFKKDDADSLRNNDLQVIQENSPFDFEEVINLKGNDHVFISHKFPIPNPWDTSQAIAGISFDISERTKSLKLLNLKSFALEAAANGIVITDVQAKILWVNPAFTKLTGYPPEEAIGRQTNILKSNTTDPALFYELWETVLSGKVWHGILTNKRKDGSTYIEEQTITPLRDEYGIISHFVAIKQDITDRVKAEEDLISAHEDLKEQYAKVEALQALLREQAIRDPLTGLFNRRYLEETLKRELAQAKRESVPASIIMIDIDHFKSINDRYGHAAGDLLLQGLSEMLRSLTREGDVTCRFGGEEFVAILPGAPLAISYARAEEWRKEFELMRVSFGDSKIFSTLSAGVAVFPDHGDNMEQLLNAADNALYQAKSNGRNQIRIYAPS
jgi:diguanylate cyclase (GGDEF)-like protein/PAS domain S-box-containing protein